MGIECLCLGGAKFARPKRMNVSFIKQNAASKARDPDKTRCLLSSMLVATK